MSKINRTIKRLAGFVVPHSVILLRNERKEKRSAAIRDEFRSKLLQEYRARPHASQFDYESAVNFLVKEGVSESDVRLGSMSEASLAYCMRVLAKELDTSKPLLGLHIGNFLGVSLAAFAEEARKASRDSFVVAVDPNLPHMGVFNTQQHVVRLLNNFGLQDNVLLVCGYSMHKSVSDDGKVAAGYDPNAEFMQQFGFENVLPKLRTLCPTRSLDFAVIDGNHQGAYLQEELREILAMLRPGGVLILDDVTDCWGDIKEVFVRLSEKSAVRVLGQDERVGIVQLARTVA